MGRADQILERVDRLLPIGPPDKVNDEERQAAAVGVAQTPAIVVDPPAISMRAVVGPDAQHRMRITVIDADLPLGHIGIERVSHASSVLETTTRESRRRNLSGRRAIRWNPVWCPVAHRRRLLRPLHRPDWYPRPRHRDRRSP